MLEASLSSSARHTAVESILQISPEEQSQISQTITAQVLLDSFSNLRVIRIGYAEYFLLESHKVEIVHFCRNHVVIF